MGVCLDCAEKAGDTLADEPQADCFAAENARDEEVRAAICYFDRLVEAGETQGDGHYLPPDERAVEINKCWRNR